MMKNSILTQILIMVFYASFTYLFAQNSPIEKGSVIISGNFSFYSAGGELYENREGDRYTVFEIDPGVNFFLNTGFSLGAKLLYEHSLRGDFSYTTWGLGPEINYFFYGGKDTAEAKGQTYPYVQGGFYYTNTSYDSFTGDMITITGTKTRLGIGIAHMISNSVALSGLAAYDIETEKREEQDSESGNQIGIYVGFLIFLY